MNTGNSMLMRALVLCCLILSGVLFYRDIVAGQADLNPDIAYKLLAEDEQKKYTAAQRNDMRKAEPREVGGIFYDQSQPRVLIGGEIFTVGDSFLGGELIRISADAVTIKFPQGEGEYRLGDFVRPEVIKGPEDKIDAQRIASYMNQANAIIKGVYSAHSENVEILYRGSGINSKETKDIEGLCVKMIKDAIIAKQNLKNISVVGSSGDCNQHFLLSLKLLDIIEDAWQAVSLGNLRKAAALSERMQRIYEKITIISYLTSR